jgi:hypothetical protein
MPAAELKEALEAHAMGSVDVIVSLASVCQVDWEEALRAYQEHCRGAAKALLERAAAAKERKASGGGRR